MRRRPLPTHARVEGDGGEEHGDDVDEEWVLEALAGRARAGARHGHDAIEAELREERHVVLDDKQGTWRVAQMFGGYIRRAQRVRSPLRRWESC